jgi:hypothetical protein
MRITEILTESQVLDELSRPSDMAAAADILEKAGYKKFGEGWYAAVYAKEHGATRVLKLFKTNDVAYLKFVNMTIQNPNIHFPKFRGKLMKITKDYYAIRMEMLTGFGEETQQLKLIRDYIYGYATYGRSYSDNMRSQEVINGIDQIEETQPGIKKACELIGDMIANDTVELDLHKHNLMMRGKTIVFTDPVN